jgi:hypothetical protein
MKIIGTNEAGETIDVAALSGMSWMVQSNSLLPDLTMTNVGVPFKSHDFPINEFFESCPIVVGGVKISRRQVISYVANTQGGTHHDPEFSAMRKQQKGSRDLAAFEALRAFDDTHSVMNRRVSFAVYMGIAQNFVEAEDVQTWLAVAENVDGTAWR